MVATTIDFHKPQIKIRANVDYINPLEKVEIYIPPPKGFWKRFRSKYYTSDEKRRLLFAHNWQGLPRYRLSDGSRPDSPYFDEYAKVTNIFHAKELKFIYKYDIPGKKNRSAPSFLGINFEESEDMGSLEHILDTPPVYSLDLIADDSNLSYGPWANRQRILIQEYFYPAHYQPLVPNSKTEIGEGRKYKSLDITFKMTGQSSSLRIPFRDLSKVFNCGCY